VYVDGGDSVAVGEAIREGVTDSGSTLASSFEWMRTVQETTNQLIKINNH